jgi:hypothetical protein
MPADSLQSDFVPLWPRESGLVSLKLFLYFFMLKVCIRINMEICLRIPQQDRYHCIHRLPSLICCLPHGAPLLSQRKSNPFLDRPENVMCHSLFKWGVRFHIVHLISFRASAAEDRGSSLQLSTKQLMLRHSQSTLSTKIVGKRSRNDTIPLNKGLYIEEV